MTEKKRSFQVNLAYSLIILLWASAFTGIRVGLESYTPEHLALLRLLVGSVLLMIVAVFTQMRLPELKDIPPILLLGFLGFAAYHTALNIGEKTVNAGVASLLVSLTPIFSALLAIMFLGERFGWVKWMGSIISFFGVAFISLEKGVSLEFSNGILIILLASICESTYFVFQTNYLRKYGFFAFTTYTIWAGTIFMLFFLPELGQEILNSSIESSLSVLYLGAIPTVIPYIALAYITSKVGAAEATISLYLTPAVAFLIAWIWLEEVPTFYSAIGGVIILFGVFVTVVKRNKVKKIKLSKNKKNIVSKS